MIQQRIFDFEEQLIISEGISDRHDIEQIIRCSIPYVVKVEQANLSDDMSGIDYWVTLESGRRLGIDTKVRTEDWRKRFNIDDVALETHSKIERDEKGNVTAGGKIGWTRNVKKKTDYILFIWDETGRYLCLPFPWLCNIFTENWEQWSKMYKRRSQFSKGLDGSRWESECVFVPRKLLWNKVCHDFAGTYSPQQQEGAA